MDAGYISGKISDFVKSEIKVYPCEHLRASNIGHPCERYLYLLIKFWEQQQPQGEGPWQREPGVSGEPLSRRLLPSWGQRGALGRAPGAQVLQPLSLILTPSCLPSSEAPASP